MPAKQPLYASPESVSSILVIGRQPNSTYDLYIEPRLTNDARQKLAYFDPAADVFDDAAVKPDQCLVIINRYVSPKVMRWLEKHKSVFHGVIWLVDDDLNAMTFGRGVTPKNRFWPALTVRYKKRLKAVVDHLIVSTRRLAAIYQDWPVVIMPPVAQTSPVEKRIDPNQLYYFAKMHGPEHRFLYPIVEHILANNEKATFTVTANGSWAKKWQRLDRVRVLSEMSYAEYSYFLPTLDSGGIFLVPLMPTWLNASRSNAKLIDVVRSGSAVIVADHPAYRTFLNDEDVKKGTTATFDVNKPIQTVEAIMNNSEVAKANRQVLKNYVTKIYENRQMIV